jgi:thioredoxin reductase (NADPH)
MESAPGTAFQRNKGFDMLVVGGGIAGLTAAWQGARRGIAVALIEKSNLFGGQVATLGEIHDFPSPTPVSGPGLAAMLVNGSRRAGASISEDEVVSLEAAEPSIRIETTRWSLRARNVVIAAGAALRELDVPGAVDKAGRGISQCVTCDGPFYRGREVVVIGGGDSALQGALELARISGRVHLITRGVLRARQAYIDAAAKCANLIFHWDSVVQDVSGDDGVDGVRILNIKTGTESLLPCYGIFPFLGTTPNAGWLPASVERTSAGLIRVDSALRTSAVGIYAIGAVREGFSGSLVSAAGDAAAVAEAIAERCRK